MSLMTIAKADARYSELPQHRLDADAPDYMTSLGNSDLLASPKIALLCSSPCPSVEAPVDAS